jgi:hypothetical protein
MMQYGYGPHGAGLGSMLGSSNTERGLASRMMVTEGPQ